jgi:mycothione reductase
VDKYLETNVKGIFALGDAVGHFQYVYHDILNSDKKISVDYAAMPHAIFSPGCRSRIDGDKNDYVKSVYPYIQTAMGKAIEEMALKFLVNRKDKRILGCHIIGTDASTLIHEGGDGTINSLKKTIHIHPALSEVIARAAESIN